MVLVPGPKPLGQRKTDVSSIDRKFDPNYPTLPYSVCVCVTVCV